MQKSQPRPGAEVLLNKLKRISNLLDSGSELPESTCHPPYTVTVLSLRRNVIGEGTNFDNYHLHHSSRLENKFHITMENV